MRLRREWFCSLSLTARCPRWWQGGLVEEFGTKLSRLIDEVKVALEGGEKVIVFSSWARLLQLAGEALADQKIVASSLSGPIDERKHALGTQPYRTLSSISRT